jgi:diguanylate cyclase (GGDEF)-like protein/PAS domain S-box-containing protein
MCVYAWRNQQARNAKAFAVACFTSVLWMTGDIIGRLSFESLTGQFVGEIVRFLGGGFLPLAMLVFVYRYCSKHISRKMIVLLCIIPIVSWMFLLTNSWHNLFFSKIQLGNLNALKVEYGYYFWYVHLPYCYILSAISFLTVFLETSRASRHYRIRLLILLLSLSIPLVVNVVGVFKLLGEFSYTSLSFPVTFSIIAIAIFRYHFLVSNPIAYETVFKTIRDGVIVLDHNNIITDINPAAAAGLHKSQKEIIGSKFENAFENWKELLERYKTVPDLYDEIELNIDGKQHYLSVTITPLENINGTLDGRIFTLRDITDRKQHQFSLETLAFHDPLTRLANRHKFQEEVERALIKSRETNEPFAILYFDLNHFKAVNDTMGHEVGDELLKYVAARVSSILRKPDLLARLGGDEFAALLHNCNDDGINIVVKRLLDNVQRPFKVGKHTLVADLSIGAAFYPENGKNLAELLRHADSAMYQAKQNGGGLALIGGEIEVFTHLSS